MWLKSFSNHAETLKREPEVEILDGAEEVVSVQEIVRARIGAMGFTPIMVHPYQATVKDDGQCVWLIHRHYVHYPQLLHYECCGKPAYPPKETQNAHISQPL
jgi:hypothetical protein